MGGCLCGRRKDGRILLLGLDGVGKTSILTIRCVSAVAEMYVFYSYVYALIANLIFLNVCLPQAILCKLKAGVNEEVDAPGQTVGFNLETITHRKREYCIWVRNNTLTHVFSMYTSHVLCNCVSMYYPSEYEITLMNRV